MIEKKTIVFRLEPYSRLAARAAMLDVVIVAVWVALSVVLDFPSIACIGVLFGYSVLALILHYRVILQALVDKRKGDLVTDTVDVQCFLEEFSFVGNRFGQSYVNSFYPKEMDVLQLKLIVVDESEKKKRLRAVMSHKCRSALAQLKKQGISRVRITYLKRSKIVIFIELAEELDEKVSRKTKTEIEKALRTLNRSV